MSFLESIFQNKNNSIVLGVDFGNFSIKIAEIQKEKDSFFITNLDEIKIEGKWSDDKKIRLLTELINKNKIKTKKVIFSIESFLTNYAIAVIPKMKKDKILKYIILNFNTFLPIDLKDVNLELKILEEDKEYFKILIIAINKKLIIKYKKIAKKANLKFYSFETEANSLINSLIKKEENSVSIILDIRMKNSSISLIKDNILLKSSDFSLSVEYFDKNYNNTSGLLRSKSSAGVNTITAKNSNNETGKENPEELIASKREELKSIQNLIAKNKKLETEQSKKPQNNNSFEVFLKQIKKKKEALLKAKTQFNYSDIADIKKNKSLLVLRKAKIENKIRNINFEIQNIKEELTELKIAVTEAVYEEKLKKLLKIKEIFDKNKNAIKVKWDIEDEMFPLINKIKDFDKKMKVLIENDEIIKKIEREIVLIKKAYIQNNLEISEKKEENIDRVFLENKINVEKEKGIITEINLLLKGSKFKKSDEVINMTSNNKTNKEAGIYLFFQLFYKKILLFIVGLEQEEQKKLRKIIISGGADFMPQLIEYLNKKIHLKFPGIKVEASNPFINFDEIRLKLKPKKINQFSNAIGAALKKVN